MLLICFFTVMPGFFSLTILFMAAEVLNRIKEINWQRLCLAFSLVSVGFILTFLYRKHYPFLTSSHYVLTLEFLLVFFTVTLAFTVRKLSYPIFSAVILFFCLFEVSINSYYQIDGIANEWVFAARSSYQGKIPAIDKLTKKFTGWSKFLPNRDSPTSNR